jgi:hypothetical protein
MSGVRMIGGEPKPPLDENLLEHFGVRGMHWGVRRESARSSGSSTGFRLKASERTPGVHPKTDKQAKAHAEEFARAKMFYGQGAGTRRKLIKATVEANKKRDPAYAKAFDQHLARQDLGQHASKARSERGRKNAAATTKKTGGAIARSLTGQMGTAAAVVALAGMGVAYSRSPHGQAMMKTTMSKANGFMADQKRQRQVSRLLKDAGLNNFKV